MVFYNAFFLISDARKQQIFQWIFMTTLFCTIFSKPYERNSTELLSDVNSESQETALDIEKERIISELKDKILFRLNMSNLPNPRRASKWNEIPEKMKMLLSQEMQAEKRKTEEEEGKLETIISPLNKVSSCISNESSNQECFNASIPNLVFKEITSAKLIAQLKSDVKTAYRNAIQFNISVNGHENVCDIVVGSNGKENIEIDLLEIFKNIIFDDNGILNSNKATTLMISIAAQNDNLPISQVLDITKMVFEVEYKPPTALRRSRRSTNMCHQNQYFCCTQTMKIDINKLQWAYFIVAPQTFTINYCKGDCNNYLQMSSNHAKALNFIRTKGHDESKDTRSCCIPYSFSSFTIMYETEENSLQVATFNDLIASSCGCL